MGNIAYYRSKPPLDAKIQVFFAFLFSFLAILGIWRFGWMLHDPEDKIGVALSILLGVTSISFGFDYMNKFFTETVILSDTELVIKRFWGKQKTVPTDKIIHVFLSTAAWYKWIKLTLDSGTKFMVCAEKTDVDGLLSRLNLLAEQNLAKNPQLHEKVPSAERMAKQEHRITIAIIIVTICYCITMYFLQRKK